MKMRAQIQRNVATNDGYGHPGPPIWVTVAEELPCYVWEMNDRLIMSSGKMQIGSPMMITKKDADISIDDRIISIIDRRGTELFTMLQIEAVYNRKDHKTARLKKIA